METQEDSIDIARLQRVALGLDHEPSQPFLAWSARIDSASQDRPNSPREQADGRSGDASSTDRGLPSKFLSNSANDSPNSQSRPEIPQQHESTPVNSFKRGTKSIAVPGSQFVGNMSSAETAPGDTQVVSQSVFDSIIKQNGESVRQDFSQTDADGTTLVTLREGDSGHIDLLSEFDAARHASHPSQDNDEESNFDPDESSPVTHQAEFFPESQRFLATTPATARKKSQAKPVTTETPSVPRNPLAGEVQSSNGLLALSQVFRATQAPSSPLVRGQQPEPVSDRPSPNIPVQQPRAAAAISSPLMDLRANAARESSQPNFNYISMKESQTKRDKVLSGRLTRSADNVRSEDQSDREFYKESSFVERARRQRQIDEETAAQFAGLAAPARSTSNLSAGRSVSPGDTVDQSHEASPMLQAAASEEETEQEEDLGPPVPRSQELPQSSIEEDKENYDGPPAPAIAASNAHDRLSQVLAFEATPSPHAEAEVEIARRDSFDGHDAGQPDSASHPPQVMVKDSQPSPPKSPSRTANKNFEDNMAEAQSRSHEMQIDPSSDLDKTSPVPQPLRSSPPPSQREKKHLTHPNANSQRQGAIVSDGPVLESGQITASDENRQTYASNLSDRQNAGSFRNKMVSGFGDKSSSVPSHVGETPVHHCRKSSGDMARLKSIPETSPNRPQGHEWEVESNGDAMNNEDDDLPPMYTAVSKTRGSQTRPSGSQAFSSPVKNLHSQILSSPSGRQRRALTEIAADVSPQVGSTFDMAIGILTADDQEFSSVVDGSPTRPKKKRRGNEGQSYQAPDRILPVAPRPQPPKSAAPVQAGPSPEKYQPVEPVHVPPKTIRPQSNPLRQTENIWEIDGSPQQPARRRSRHRKPAPSRHAKSRAPVSKPEKPALARPVVVHNPQPTASSGLTGVRLESSGVIEPENSIVKHALSTPKQPQTFSDDLQVAPSQVLAVWMGLSRAYYPATCFGTPLGASQSKYTVKFEDSSPVEVPKGAVKRFELRVGDAVKVDMRTVPKVTHIVRGFDDRLTREDLARAADDGHYPQTDIYGHTTVILGPKQRNSLPNGGLNSSENVIKVPIARIYLDTMLWNRLQDRAFTYRPESVRQENTFHTPSEKSSAPASPSARFSRSIQHASGIFATMAFAVSYKEHEEAKNHITKLITENGGTVLHEGFTELFETPSIVPVGTPTKSGAKAAGSSSGGLRLTAHAKEVGFVCLIADTHSRREKYMQALALNLPCLSGRWVEDCVANGRVLGWDMYLLPAGESMYLNGATKSRIMTPTPPSTARLADTISARPKLLDGQSVLLVTGRGKAEEKRKAYIFLTYALGPSRVERVPDLETAKALLESQADAGLPTNWDWIYVDDAEQAAAKSMLTPRSKTQKIHLLHGGKRRISGVLTVSTAGPGVLCTARVVSNEFVCQSLILGRLFEERDFVLPR